MATRNVVLTKPQSALIDQLVSSGRYHSKRQRGRAHGAATEGHLEREEVELSELRARLAVGLQQARSGDFDQGNEGVGEQAVRRAFAAARTHHAGRRAVPRPVPKPWRLTRHAETSLGEIARWTLDTFGPRQAAAYEQDLIDCCSAIAAGEAMTRECRRLIGPNLPEDFAFCSIRRALHSLHRGCRKRQHRGLPPRPLRPAEQVGYADQPNRKPAQGLSPQGYKKHVEIQALHR